MITVTDGYKDAVIAPVRETRAEVLLELIAVDAKNGGTCDVTAEAEVSRKDQILTELFTMEKPFATMERDYWKADGSFGLMPKKNEIPEMHLGWWSKEISDLDGAFETPQAMTITTELKQTSLGFGLYFDTRAGEYASDFQITIYSDDEAIYHAQIEDYGSSIYAIEETLEGYNRIEVVCYKTNKPGRRLRISGVTFGVVKVFDEESIIQVNAIEEIDILNGSVPCNELDFTIENLENAFNIVNPGGIYQYLQERQPIRAKIGVVREDGITEYVDIGRYYLNEWMADDITASFTCRDILDFIADEKYTNDGAMSLKEWAVDILTSLEIEKYHLASSLADIDVETALTAVSVKEALQYIAVAGNCTLFVDRNNRICIENLLKTEVDAKISFDNMYQKPSISLDRIINKIVVPIYRKEAESYEETYIYVDPNRKVSDPDFIYEVADNPFIVSAEQASEVAKHVLRVLKQRLIYQVAWRQNPALLVGDMIQVEDGYNENKTVMITKQEYSYEGWLSGTTEGKGS